MLLLLLLTILYFSIVSLSISSHNWLKSYFYNRSFSVNSGSSSSSILPSSWRVTQGAILGPIFFTIFISPFASIISSHDDNQQQYADNTHLFLSLSPASLSSSLCSLQRCVSSLHSWFLQNGLVLNSTKTEAICFGTSPRLKSLDNLTSIEGAGTSVPLVDYVKLLLTAISMLLSTCLTSALHPTSISVLCSSSYFHIRALRHLHPILDSETSKTMAIVGSRLDYVINFILNRPFF